MLHVLQLLGSKYTAISVFATTFMSSLFHEYIIATGVKFFLPLLTVLFSGFGGTQYLLIHNITADFSPYSYVLLCQTWKLSSERTAKYVVSSWTIHRVWDNGMGIWI